MNQITRWRSTRPQTERSPWLSTRADRSTPVVLTVVVAAALVLMSLLGFERTTVEFLIMLTAVVGLYSYSGITGIASFGHVGFMAVGGYVATILTIPAVVKSYRLPGLPESVANVEMDPYAALVIAWIAGTLLAAVFGLLVWRLNGLAAGIATLALLVVLYTVASGWESVTGGRGAVPGVPQIADLAPALIIAIAAILATVLFQHSRWARFAQAAREDEPAARAIGIRIHVVRWLAMTFSGGVMAVAGALYVYFVGSISPDFFYVSMMFNVLAILVIGGMYSVTGAVIGTVVVMLIRQLLAPLDDGFSLLGLTYPGFPGLRFVVLGAIMLLILARRPGGIARGHELRLPDRKRLRRQQAQSDSVAAETPAEPSKSRPLDEVTPS